MLQTLKEITLSTEHHFESAVAIKNNLLLQIIFKANVLVAKVILRPDFFPCCIKNGNVSWLFLSSISSNLFLGTVLLSCPLHLCFPRVKLSSRTLNPCKILCNLSMVTSIMLNHEGSFPSRIYLQQKKNTIKSHCYPNSEVSQSTVELELHSAIQPFCNQGMEGERGNWKDGNAWGI